MLDNGGLSKSACPLNRRQFLGGCAACAAGFAGISALGAKSAAANQTIGIPTEKAKVRLVFTHRPPKQAGWPYLGYDFEARKKELTEKLHSTCPAIEFLPATVQNAKDAGNILKADTRKDIDGYLVYMLSTATDKASRIIVGYSKRPTIVVDDLYGGTGAFLPTYAAAQAKKPQSHRRIFVTPRGCCRSRPLLRMY